MARRLAGLRAAARGALLRGLGAALAEPSAREALSEGVLRGLLATPLLEAADDLARLGLVVEPFGPGAVAVGKTPAILGEVNAAALLRDILDELTDQGEATGVQARIDAILPAGWAHGARYGTAMAQGPEGWA